MTYAFISNDGLVHSNDPSFVTRWNNATERYYSKLELWTERMIKLGCKLVHPDDGWVNRKNNSVIPCYPSYYNTSAKVGDLVALGTPEKWRVVRITELGKPLPITGSQPYSFDAKPFAHGEARGRRFLD